MPEATTGFPPRCSSSNSAANALSSSIKATCHGKNQQSSSESKKNAATRIAEVWQRPPADDGNVATAIVMVGTVTAEPPEIGQGVGDN